MSRLTRPLVSTLLAATLFVAGFAFVLFSQIFAREAVTNDSLSAVVFFVAPPLAKAGGAVVGWNLLSARRAWRIAVIAGSSPIPAALLFGVFVFSDEIASMTASYPVFMPLYLCVSFLVALWVTAVCGLIAASPAEAAPDPYVWLAWGTLGHLWADFAFPPLLQLGAETRLLVIACLFALLGMLLVGSAAILRGSAVRVPFLPLFRGLDWRRLLTPRVCWLTLTACPVILIYPCLNHLSVEVSPFPLLQNLLAAIGSFALTLAFLGAAYESPGVRWCLRLLALAPWLIFGALMVFETPDSEFLVPTCAFLSAMVVSSLIPNRWSLLPQLLATGTTFWCLLDREALPPLWQIALVVLTFGAAARSCFSAALALRPAREHAAEFLAFQYLGGCLGTLTAFLLYETLPDFSGQFPGMLAVALAAPVLMQWVANRNPASRGARPAAVT